MDGIDRGDIDDCPGSAGDKGRSSSKGQAGEDIDVERDHVAHLVDLRAEQRCCASDPCVIDQHRDPRISVQCLFDRRDTGWVGEVSCKHVDLAPGPFDHLTSDNFQTPPVSRNQNKVMAAVCQPIGINRPYP